MEGSVRGDILCTLLCQSRQAPCRPGCPGDLGIEDVSNLTPIADMVAKMLAAGTPHEIIVLAIQTAEAAGSCRVDNRVDEAADKRRKWDREYRRNKRCVHLNPPDNPPEVQVDVKPTSIEALSIEIEDKKERKKERGRGTRLPPDWEPTQVDINFAVSHGWSDERIKVESLKFRNYWTSKTGQGATKMHWGRTWQNWVLNSRSQFQKEKQNVGIQANGNLLAVADQYLAAFRDARICDGEDAPPLRAIPKGGGE